MHKKKAVAEKTTFLPNIDEKVEYRLKIKNKTR